MTPDVIVCATHIIIRVSLLIPIISIPHDGSKSDGSDVSCRINLRCMKKDNESISCVTYEIHVCSKPNVIYLY